MKFIISSIILAGAAYAKVALTNSDFSDIEAGAPFEITWSGAEGPVTITLKTGTSTDLKDVSTIASAQTGESFSWTPTSDLDPTALYALEISDGTDINYSEQFSVEGGSGSASSSSVVSVSSTSAVSSYSASSVSASSTASTASSTASSASASSASSASVTSSSAAVSSTSSANSTVSITSSATTSASLTRSVTSAVQSSTGEAEPTTVPGTNNAQGVVAPLVAPLLMAIGAAALF